jgi:predicted O-methyltransferase YrrM
MWFKIISYLLFLIKSKNQHGVHSPFVYHLITNCFYGKTNDQHSTNFKAVKAYLLSNQNTIKVTDFGKGSKVFKSNIRKVSDIAKIAGITTKKALLLIRLIAYTQPKKILEIGTSVGLGTSAMAIASNTARITTLEGCANTAHTANLAFKKHLFNNIQFIIGNFNSTLPKALKNETFDIVYFDGNHKKEATLNYFNLCIKAAHNNSIFIFDDIYWNSDMLKAWEIIKQHPKVSVTINMYFWGIVFFRKEQLKQHFTIRV